MVLVTIALKARSICMIIPAEAPKATTRALEASKDLVNSSALTVALERPVPKARIFSPPPAPPPNPLKALLETTLSFSISLRIRAKSLSAFRVSNRKSTVTLSRAIFLVYYYTVFGLRSVNFHHILHSELPAFLCGFFS